MYAKQRRSRLAAGERGVGCAGVFGGGGGGGAYVSKRVIGSRVKEEALLLLYLQLYFVVAVAFLDHFCLVYRHFIFYIKLSTSSPLNFSFSSLPFCLLCF